MEHIPSYKSPVNPFDPLSFIGKEIENITLVSLLGRGAMGAVFIGYQKSLKRKVAVKIFPKSSSDNSSMHLRFRDEAEIVAVLNHPNIIPVFDMGQTDELLYIVMQLIDGEDLRTTIRKHLLHPVPSKRIIPLQSILQIMVQIIDALAYAHDEGIIHRDIKPANIIIDSRGKRPYLADFGIAQTTLTESSMLNTVLGTPLYISPEQVRDGNVDSRADVYSAGIVLFELITGKLPLSTTKVKEVLKIKMYEPENLFTCSPSAASPLIDRDLEQIINRAISPDIDDRYISSKIFYQELNTYYVRTFPGNKL